jgi:hypothetical protein
VKQWIDRHGGLTADMKTIQNGPELWAIIDPCPKTSHSMGGRRKR